MRRLRYSFQTLWGTPWDAVFMYRRKLMYIQSFTAPVSLTLHPIHESAKPSGHIEESIGDAPVFGIVESDRERLAVKLERRAL